MQTNTLKRLIKVAAAGALIVVVGYAAFLWYDGRALQQRLEALRKAGEPATMADLKTRLAQTVPPEDNAAHYLKQAHIELTAAHDGLMTVIQSEGFADGRLGESELATVEAVFGEHPKLIPLLHQAGRCAVYDPEWDFDVDPQVFVTSVGRRTQNSRIAVRVLTAHAYGRLAEGDPQAALESCLAILQLSRHFSREPTIIGYLVSVATRSIGASVANGILRSGNLPPSAYAAMDVELASHEDDEAYRWAIQTERVIGLENMQTFRIGPIWLISTRDQMQYLDLMGQELETASQPYWELVVDEEGRRPSDVKLRPMTALLVPSLEQARLAKETSAARLRCLRILNALQRQSASGDEQTAGAAAVPDLSSLNLPADVLIDPFTGRPLQVKQTPQGWLIYSVGKNRQDDGGEFSDNLDVGVGPISADDPE